METTKEVVVHYGVDEKNVPFVITAKGVGNNIPRKRYDGKDIPESCILEIKQQAVDAQEVVFDREKYDQFINALPQGQQAIDETQTNKGVLFGETDQFADTADLKNPLKLTEETKSDINFDLEK